MPVKWTPETDQILLLKILETSQISVDVKAVSAAWPEGQESPTPRAISERLVKIRAMAKENGSKVGFTVSSGKNSSAPATPRKKAAKDTVPKKAGGGIVKKKGVARRKRAEKVETSNSEDSGANTIENDDMDEVDPADEAHAHAEV